MLSRVPLSPHQAVLAPPGDVITRTRQVDLRDVVVLEAGAGAGGCNRLTARPRGSAQRQRLQAPARRLCGPHAGRRTAAAGLARAAHRDRQRLRPAPGLGRSEPERSRLAGVDRRLVPRLEGLPAPVWRERRGCGRRRQCRSRRNCRSSGPMATSARFTSRRTGSGPCASSIRHARYKCGVYVSFLAVISLMLLAGLVGLGPFLPRGGRRER